MLILFLLLPIKTHAIYEVTDSRCTNDIKMELRSLSIPITYKTTKVIEKGKVLYSVNLYNINESMYALDSATNKKYTSTNSKILDVEPGTILYIYIYANENTYCNGYRINTITIQIPYYNKYSTNALCKGYENYTLCNENISLNITLEEFELRMKNYIASLNLKSDDNKNNEIDKPSNSNNTKLTFFDFIIKYNEYISGFGVLLLVIYIIVVVNSIKKKRGIL